MNEQERVTDLEARLSGLTEWSGRDGAVWRGALESSRRGLRGRLLRITQGPARRMLPIAALLLLVLGVTVVALTQGPVRFRSARPPSASYLGEIPFDRDRAVAEQEGKGRAVYRYGSVSESKEVRAGMSVLGQEALEGRRVTDYSGVTALAWDALRGQPSQQAAGGDRQVVRKATVELKTPDVRAAFLKAGLIVNLAGSEFVEASTLTGEGNATAGSLTLRVAVERLSEVLNQLRGLGTVITEQTTGDDVTDKAVDLEARLRNERRIETELLELVNKRPDAPLKEILEVREQLGRVRESIEQLTAQRERLGRLVSLGTVLVLIRTDGAPEPAKAGVSIGAYFAERMGAAWESGLRGLVQTVAWLVNVAVGGLIWWVIALAALIGARAMLRRSAAKRATEPAPAM